MKEPVQRHVSQHDMPLGFQEKACHKGNSRIRGKYQRQFICQIFPSPKANPLPNCSSSFGMVQCEDNNVIVNNNQYSNLQSNSYKEVTDDKETNSVDFDYNFESRSYDSFEGDIDESVEYRLHKTKKEKWRQESLEKNVGIGGNDQESRGENRLQTKVSMDTLLPKLISDDEDDEKEGEDRTLINLRSKEGKESKVLNENNIKNLKESFMLRSNEKKRLSSTKFADLIEGRRFINASTQCYFGELFQCECKDRKEEDMKNHWSNKPQIYIIIAISIFYALLLVYFTYEIIHPFLSRFFTKPVPKQEPLFHKILSMLRLS